jgi:hypothetical protein
MDRVIWQYWETRGKKPAFVDGLHRLARQNSGCEVVLVTPQNLSQYLPDLPREISKIKTLAHKADMIRAMLIARHGGMWLDSDAVVLRDLSWLFDFLEEYDFVGFNNLGLLQEVRPWVRVNCFLSRAGGCVATEWVRQQHAKFPRTRYNWEEIGTEILHPICLSNKDRVKFLPFEEICPIPWDRVDELMAHDSKERIAEKCYIVMLSNASLAKRAPHLRNLSCQDMAEGDYLISTIVRDALRGNRVDDPTSALLSQWNFSHLAASVFRRCISFTRRR